MNQKTAEIIIFPNSGNLLDLGFLLSLTPEPFQQKFTDVFLGEDSLSIDPGHDAEEARDILAYCLEEAIKDGAFKEEALQTPQVVISTHRKMADTSSYAEMTADGAVYSGEDDGRAFIESYEITGDICWYIAKNPEPNQGLNQGLNQRLNQEPSDRSL